MHPSPSFALLSRDGELTSLGQEGVAESIAYEDGERQIACAIAFQGEEMVNDYYPKSLPLIAHRSTSGTKPSNSLSKILRIP